MRSPSLIYNLAMILLFSPHNIGNLISIVRHFEKASGLDINCQKSEFLGIGIDSRMLSHLGNWINCKSGAWPCTYLGLPLDGKPNASFFQEPVVEKIEKRLSVWESSHLSKDGRVTQTSYFFKSPYLLLVSLQGSHKSGQTIKEALQKLPLEWQQGKQGLSSP